MNKLITLLSLFLLFVTNSAFTACTDNVNKETEDAEFTTNWKERNAQYFDSLLNVARQKVTEARTQYGDDWEQHCEWRVFLSYAKSTGGPSTDSICARVISTSSSTDARIPLYTDSVKINYMGHLIPTISYKEGRVFDHSGIYENNDYVFSPTYSVPARFAVSNLVEGLTTAIMHMHINDRWMVYIPQELGYGKLTRGVMPSYSTLCFDLQLKDICRKGDSFQ